MFNETNESIQEQKIQELSYRVLKCGVHYSHLACVNKEVVQQDKIKCRICGEESFQLYERRAARTYFDSGSYTLSAKITKT